MKYLLLLLLLFVTSCGGLFVVEKYSDNVPPRIDIELFFLFMGVFRKDCLSRISKLLHIKQLQSEKSFLMNPIFLKNISGKKGELSLIWIIPFYLILFILMKNFLRMRLYGTIKAFLIKL